MKNLAPFLFVLVFLIGACIQSNEEQGKVPSEKLWTEAERQLLIKELERTANEMVAATNELDTDQWHFKASANSWSIAEVVEHVELQDEMYYRELYLISKTPELPQYIEVVKGNDPGFLAYATDPKPGKTSWNLEPIGRFCDQPTTIRTFSRTRGEIVKFVSETSADFRKHFTFRNYVPDGGLSNPGLWDVRDLHQLLLTTIAHTDRHLAQISRIKAHAGYPQP